MVASPYGGCCHTSLIKASVISIDFSGSRDRHLWEIIHTSVGHSPQALKVGIVRKQCQSPNAAGVTMGGGGGAIRNSVKTKVLSLLLGSLFQHVHRPEPMVHGAPASSCMYEALD